MGVPCHWTEIIHNGQEDCSVGLDQGMARPDMTLTGESVFMCGGVFWEAPGVLQYHLIVGAASVLRLS